MLSMKRLGIFGLLFLFSSLASAVDDLVFITPDSLPWQYKTETGMAGPFIDVLEAVCEEAQLNCQTRWVKSWIRAKKLVQQGEADGIGVIKWSEKRELWYFFSPPLFETEYGMFVKSSDPKKYVNISDFSNKTLAVHSQSATSYSLDKFIWRMDNIELTQQFDLDYSIRALATYSQIDAAYISKNAGFSIAKKYGHTDAIRYAMTFEPVKYHFAMSNKRVNSVIANKLFSAYRRLYRSGTIDALVGDEFKVSGLK